MKVPLAHLADIPEGDVKENKEPRRKRTGY